MRHKEFLRSAFDLGVATFGLTVLSRSEHPQGQVIVVTLSAAEHAALARREAVLKISSCEDGHAHDVMLVCV